jgi:hypothetical protein
MLNTAALGQKQAIASMIWQSQYSVTVVTGCLKERLFVTYNFPETLHAAGLTLALLSLKNNYKVHFSGPAVQRQTR